MEDSTIIEYSWSLHTVDRIDVYFGPEIDVFEKPFIWCTVELDDDFGASYLILLVDQKFAVLIWEVEIDGYEFILQPPGDPWFHGFLFHIFSELFAIDHV